MIRELIAFCLHENEAWNLTSALTMFFACCAGLRLLQLVLVRRLSQSAPQTDMLLDDLVLDIARRTSPLFQVAVGLAAAASMIDLPATFAKRLHASLVIVFLLQGGAWVTGLWQYVLIGLLDRRAEPGDVSHRTGKNMLRFLGLATVWSLTALLVLENLGVHVSALLTGLSVTGLILGLALQPVVGDLMSSVSILLDKPFLVGDFIACDLFVGTIEKIGIRSTRIRALSGEAVVLANFDLARARLRNYKSLRERRQSFVFCLRFGSSPEALAALPDKIRALVQGVANTRFDRAHLLAMTELGPQFEVVFFVTVPDYLAFCDAQHAINLGLLRLVASQGLQFAHRAQLDRGVGLPATDASA